MTKLSPEEIRQLEEHGITEDEAARQLDLLADPPPPLCLDRPCTPGDGIDRLEGAELESLGRRHDQAALEGRCLKFVPASGAATRMFRDLLECLAAGRPLLPESLKEAVASGDGTSGRLLEFLGSLERMPFLPDLASAVRARGGDLEELAARGPYDQLLRCLLTEEGLGYASLPKGLLKFHRYGDRTRTPFEEHLIEASRLFRDRSNLSRLHFTVSAGHQSRFEETLDSLRPELERESGSRFDVAFSIQQPGTDTLAMDVNGEPFRLSDGKLLLRPAGHGALLGNLSALGADVVFLKNIDNVAQEHSAEETRVWIRALIGRLLALEEEIHALAGRLEMEPGDEEAVARAGEFLRRSLHVDLGGDFDSAGADSRRERALRCLDRPLRVCGMVRNTGEPGGGPFWVRGRDGTLSLQIVETAQIDTGSSGQSSILKRSTHFNPVFMACSLRDRLRRQHDLERHVDPDAIILTTKSHEGRKLTALERPGLWNGSMSDWNTNFVEVPEAVLNPVKTVHDLLRPAHQPA